MKKGGGGNAQSWLVAELDWTDTLGACPPSPTEPEVGITTLMQRMKTLSEQTEECTPVELAKRFENIEVSRCCKSCRVFYLIKCAATYTGLLISATF